MTTTKGAATSGATPSQWCPDRRMLLRMGVLGVGALATPGAAQIVAAARGFTHGVASGEPGGTSVLLWTRFVSAAADTRLTVEMSDTPAFTRIAAGGSATARAAADHTAKVTIGGLTPGRWYHYRFIAPDGSISMTGRTRTLPVGATAAFNLGVFSCANMGFGFFNAYADAAQRGDIDLAVHLGDYLYEYAPGVYPGALQTVPDRVFAPPTETVHLADYRLRFASYRSDPALQRLHQMIPMIAMWDDHELANDAWAGGAQNHDAATQGDWATRKLIAMRAYHEWMPVSDARYRSYEIGDLATIALPETRITGRMRQFEMDEVTAGQVDVAAALRAFRDGAWQDPARSLIGAEQEAWLGRLFATSVRRRTRWQVLAQQVIMGNLNQPPEAVDWVPATAPDYIRRRVASARLAAQAGLPFNFDAWDGYPAARARVLGAAQSAGANLVTLSGDSHNGWAFNLAHDDRPAGIEFAGQSVTSSGFESYLPVAPQRVAAALRAANPGLRWVDTSRRGYMHVVLGPDTARSTWRMWDSVRSAAAPMTTEVSQSVRHGTNILTEA